MKNVLIIGATGSLAQYVIEAVREIDNVHLTLFARNKMRLSKYANMDIDIVQGDAMNYNDVKNGVDGQNVVYVNLAGNLEAMANNIVRAMREAGAKRIIAISSIGIYDKPLKPVLLPYRKLADVIEASGLDYTILRPDWFTDGNKIEYALTKKGEPEEGTAISRKSIAAFVAFLVKDPQDFINANLGISRPVAKH